MPAEPDSVTRMTAIETWAWGRFGNNGVNSDVRRHSEQIGELFGRDDAMRIDVDRRMVEFERRMNDKFDGLYKLVTTVGVSILIGVAAILVALVTRGGV